MTKVLTFLMDALTGHERITLDENERMLILRQGRLSALLGPGEHRIRRADSAREKHKIDGLRFVSAFDRTLFRTRPDLAEPHLMEVKTGATEVAVITRDGRPKEVLFPEERSVLWMDAGPFEVERFDMTETTRVAPDMARRIEKAGIAQVLTMLHVPEGQVGMLLLDGVLSGRLEPGVHAFWAVRPMATMRLVDMRARAHEVVGQEILTKDRVTIRVNLTAIFRVTDPEQAVTSVTDFEEALHRAVQLVFRRRLGALTLDQLLAEKGAIDVEAGETLRAEMAQIGIDLKEIALKEGNRAEGCDPAGRDPRDPEPCGRGREGGRGQCHPAA